MDEIELRGAFGSAQMRYTDVRITLIHGEFEQRGFIRRCSGRSPRRRQNAARAEWKSGTIWGPHVARDHKRPAEMRSSFAALRARTPCLTCRNAPAVEPGVSGSQVQILTARRLYVQVGASIRRIGLSLLIFLGPAILVPGWSPGSPDWPTASATAGP
jgi:hypothetical protein